MRVSARKLLEEIDGWITDVRFVQVEVAMFARLACQGFALEEGFGLFALLGRAA